MTDDVKAMIDGTVREWKEEWPKVKRQESQKPTQGPSAPVPFARDDNSIVEAARAPSPEEVIEAAYHTLKECVKAELLGRIKAASPKFFEKLAVELMVRLGYGGQVENAGEVIGQSGDEGMDGVIKEDRLGFDLVYVQAKRWNHDVSRDEIQKFVGALHGKKASKGVFVTTSSFTKSAVGYASGLEGTKVILIDGEKLTELMFESGLGVVSMGAYEVKRIDAEYFVEDSC